MIRRSSADCSTNFADFRSSTNLLPNKKSSTDVALRVSLIEELTFVKINCLRIKISSCMKSANKRLASLKASMMGISVVESRIRSSDITFPMLEILAESLSCFSVMRISLARTFSVIARLTSAFNFGELKNGQFLGGGYFLQREALSSEVRPNFIISAHLIAKSAWTGEAETFSSSSRFPITLKISLLSIFSLLVFLFVPCKLSTSAEFSWSTAAMTGDDVSTDGGVRKTSLLISTATSRGAGGGAKVDVVGAVDAWGSMSLLSSTPPTCPWTDLSRD